MAVCNFCDEEHLKRFEM